MKAYKVFNNDWTCNGFQYEVGKTYTIDGDIKLCESGFHACKNLSDCFIYYDCVPWNKIAEVELVGEIQGVDGDKQVTDKIKIIKEVMFEDIGKIIKKDLSDGVNGADGVSRSHGVNWSHGVNGSHGVNWSDGVNGSHGVSRSDGVDGSHGVDSSFGILNSYGITESLFVCDMKKIHYIFNVRVSKSRYNEVLNELYEKLNNWTPTYNNLKSLYLKNGNDWKKTPIPEAKEIQKKDAWRDMPKEAVKFIKSLREYNADIFYEITGIK